MNIRIILFICLSWTSSVYANEQQKVNKDMLEQKIESMNKEKEKLRIEYELEIQKQKNMLLEMEKKYNDLSLKNKLFMEKINNEIAEIKAQIEQLSASNKLAEEKNKQELSKLSFYLNKLKIENDIEAEKIKAEKRKIEEEKNKMDFERDKIKHELFLKQNEIDLLKAELDFISKKEELKRISKKEPTYDQNIFRNGSLIISDRRIPLNGVITTKTADYIVDRINYYNNISTAPIFIVIDRSPGGSVMAGYKILKAIESSKAPVYLVVKSYAASMAAVITTLSKRSFVYPNAIILHHQMSTMAWGNITQIKERLEMARKWEKRLLGPVAKKIGFDIEEFRKKMYENNSDGDWEEFGDEAVKLKWADSVVDNIVEEGIVKDPDYYEDKKFITSLEEKIDEKGKRYVDLPRLDPFDFYFLYNPDNYYRYNY
ncbi:MAG: ATP-dependent Clp protease proteolytic subunit [Elusimicrobiales bacterium]|nr:ATP-dependent Clp protease proteolytic subunit [Elusimicrobiales bacterium]